MLGVVNGRSQSHGMTTDIGSLSWPCMLCDSAVCVVGLVAKAVSHG